MGEGLAGGLLSVRLLRLLPIRLLSVLPVLSRLRLGGLRLTHLARLVCLSWLAGLSDLRLTRLLWHAAR
ncbi:hypothetical protein [Saccharomonospora sp.]|uniref:hypothetical protein n=1 Tax=Saccharomonospora sp. TaxID=33913 RepID=UPI0026357EB3|nr:hypothetical protein [Saccharomonospora sp.]